MTLLAVRLIDLAIFGSLGGLWIGGAIFIVVLYRWILRFEAGEGPTRLEALPTRPEPAVSAPARTPVLSEPALRSVPVVPQAAASYGALPSHT